MANTNYLTLGQAAIYVEKSKPTISKALKTGKLSYISKNKSGYQIEKSELDRVYGHAIKATHNETQNLTAKQETFLTSYEQQLNSKNEIIESKNNMIENLEKQIIDLIKQREAWEQQATSQTRLLEHQSSKKSWFNFGKK